MLEAASSMVALVKRAGATAAPPVPRTSGPIAMEGVRVRAWLAQVAAEAADAHCR